MEKLTAKEEEVMQVLWKMEPCYVKDMVPHFTNPPLHYNTVSTIVRNLEEKGYVGHRAYGNTHEYYALVSKEDYQNRFVLKKVVDDYFDNSYKNLVSYFAQNEKISADELREILAMIEKKVVVLIMETLRYVLLTNGLLAVVTIAFYVLLRRETFFGANRLALWLGLTASLVLPLLKIPDWRPQPVRAVMQRTAQVIVPRVLPGSPAPKPEVTITFPNGRTYPIQPMKQPTGFTWSWQAALIALYTAGVLLLLIRLSSQLVSLRKLISRSEHDDYGDFTLVRNERVQSPFSFFGWVVLNPACHAPDELEQILRHERVHVRARHSFDMIGAELVCIVFWFNPAAYLYNLVKVSLSAGQSVITNHFSRSQLKSRIIMLNKPESSKATWLKYPVLCLAALTIATSFARPSAQTLKKFVPAPVAETVALVISPAEIVTEPAPAAEAPVRMDTIGQTPLRNSKPTANQSLVVAVDSVRNAPGPESARSSPSRYIIYQGDYLYWIITPKMTLDDFTVLKQELAQYGCQLRLDELKYDPLHAYIENLAFWAIGPGGGRTHVNEVEQANRQPVAELNQINLPLPTLAGYPIYSLEHNHKDHAVWASRLDGRFSPKFPLYQTPGEVNFPAALRTVAAEDEAAVSRFIAQNRMDYLILAGERKFGPLGIGFRKFDKEFVKKEANRGGFVEVDADGFLSVDRIQNSTKVFINNEPVSHEAIRRIHINRLHTMAVTLGYDHATQKRTMTEYLVFYINEDN